ncbi:MAG: phosphotransferase family protein [Pseudomonadota bacterium]
MNETSPRLIDKDKLDAWLVSTGLKTGDDLKVHPLKGGRSNEMFVLGFDNHECVLRRPSGVAWEKAEKGLEREYRIQETLKDTEVPCPTPLAICRDQSVLGTTFYIMEKVDGFNPAMTFPDAFMADDDVKVQTAVAGLNAIASLHSVDWQACGLTDFGRPADFHHRQVSRWSKQLKSYAGRDLPELVEVGSWIGSNIPDNWRPTIMHGDYHPLNVLMANQLPPRISAIVDWETCTIGDPFLDVVGYLDVWNDANGALGFPDGDYLLDCYLSQVDFEPDNYRYYQALYYFRQAVLLEGIYQRSLLDDSRETQYGVGDHVDRLVERASKVICSQNPAARCIL